MDTAEFVSAEGLNSGTHRTAAGASAHAFLDTEREELLVEAARLHSKEPPPAEAFLDEDTESEPSAPSPLPSHIPAALAGDSAHSLSESPQPPSLEEDKWHQSSADDKQQFSFLDEKPQISVVENLIQINEPTNEHETHIGGADHKSSGFSAEELNAFLLGEDPSPPPVSREKPSAPREKPLAAIDEAVPLSPLPSPAPPPPSPAPQRVPAEIHPPKDEPVRPKCPPPKVPQTPASTSIPDVIEAELIFRRMGLDAWFDPARLHPKVESLVYWRDPVRSGAALGGGLALLLALACCSLISVTSWLALLALSAAIVFRVYRGILTAVRKTPDGHPFADWLDQDVKVPPEKAQQLATSAVAHLNAASEELRRLFLVEDLVDSLRFGLLLWVLTYIGAAFNGITLLILGYIALFSLPKVYETNKAQIDANLDLTRAKIKEISDKVRAAVPLGKKVESEKDK